MFPSWFGYLFGIGSMKGVGILNNWYPFGFPVIITPKKEAFQLTEGKDEIEVLN